MIFLPINPLKIPAVYFTSQTGGLWKITRIFVPNSKVDKTMKSKFLVTKREGTKYNPSKGTSDRKPYYTFQVIWAYAYARGSKNINKFIIRIQ